VRVLLPAGETLTGEATEVDGAGQLVVRTADGAEHRVSAGDVLHVR
jgi:BirA family biotin operon repressor/biotin-[acetyl-CoA-carboxylase] ligase